MPDPYVFRARVIPVVVVIVPPLVLLGAGVISGARLGVATGLVTTVLAAIAGQLGRDRGRVLQDGLWAEWGGSPTLQRLRFRGAARPQRVERLHARVEAALGERLPTQAEEDADPDAADDAYQEAIGRLIALTRDKERFRLLFDEN